LWGWRGWAMKRVDLCTQVVVENRTGVYAPKCPTKKHDMVISAGTYRTFCCNRCGQIKSGMRWFCEDCRDDFCFECEPQCLTTAGKPYLKFFASKIEKKNDKKNKWVAGETVNLDA